MGVAVTDRIFVSCQQRVRAGRISCTDSHTFPQWSFCATELEHQGRSYMVVLLEHIMQWSVHDTIAVKTNPQVILTSDASGSRGCDAFTWFQLKWTGHTTSFYIAVKEIVITAAIRPTMERQNSVRWVSTKLRSNSLLPVMLKHRSMKLYPIYYRNLTQYACILWEINCVGNATFLL